MSWVLQRRQLSRGKQKKQRQQVAAAMPPSAPSLRGASTLRLHGNHPITLYCTPGSPVQRGHGPEQKAGLGPEQVVRVVIREPEAKKIPAPVSSEQLQSVLPGVQEAVVWFSARVVVLSSPLPPPSCGCVCVCLLHLKYPESLQKGCEV